MLGYLRFPTISGDRIAFVAEDDLWLVPSSGGMARRLTTSLGPVSRPRFSPDGRWIAFTCREEGHDEVYCLPAEGGVPRRLTFLGSDGWVAGWTPEGEIAFSSHYGQAHVRWRCLFAVSREGGHPRPLPYGPALTVAYGPGGAVVIGRHTTDLSYWKRYRGGRAGRLWIDPTGSGAFRPLIDLPGNLCAPVWLGQRVCFASDHEGTGNLYACAPDGSELERLSDHEVYCARYPASDGQRVVYQAAADLWLLDSSGPPRRIDVELASPRTQRKRRFVEAARYLEDYAIHPDGHSLVVTTRGRPCTFAHWEGAVRQVGAPHGVRYRLARYLAGGRHLVCTSDEGGEERLEVHPLQHGAETAERLDGLDLGRPHELVASPVAPLVALANHRQELLVVDLPTRRLDVVARSEHGRIEHLAWSPCGSWLAASVPQTAQTSAIVLHCRLTGQTHRITPPRHRDTSPSWDPEGRYLYLLSYRVFDPVYDSHFFELSFPRGARPFAISLRRDLPSPFLPAPRSPAAKPGAEPAKPKDKEKDKDAEGRLPPIAIDLDGIERRVVPFPVREARYTRVAGLKGKVLLQSLPIEGSLGRNWADRNVPANATLEVYDLEKQATEPLLSAVSSFALSPDAKVMAVRVGPRLRVLKAGDRVPKADKKTDGTFGRQSGWIDLRRIKLEVDPPAEWRQMMGEAWRLMRDQFWSADMSGVDWAAVREAYLPLLDRVTTRGELSDLIWEMQGELGTSHAYEIGGDYRAFPRYAQGFLGADLELDARSGRYRVARILEGDPWTPAATSALNRLGAGVTPGCYLLAIAGREVGAQAASPQELLVHRAGDEVELAIADTPDGTVNPRTVVVKALASEQPARYRDWVESNRRTVHDATAGRVGYIHIPDMGPNGYAEFHRAWQFELPRTALIVDVRSNGGGHVSQLILEKLARRRIGYDLSRWGRPEPYPRESPAGPLVALTDENAGSDGDIFSHGFKMYGLGPLIGKRTWGGVVGIWPRHPLVDGSVTTQPEFSFWFADVEWGIENHGTEPDIDVEITPQDHAARRDPQLERAIAEALRRLDGTTIEAPRDTDPRPDRRRPPLPPR